MANKNNIETLKKMIAEPASKEWFSKHGMPKGAKAQGTANELHRRVNAGMGRKLTKEESAFKTKDWPKGKAVGMKEQMGRTEENKATQRRTGRAWNE